MVGAGKVAVWIHYVFSELGRRRRQAIAVVAGLGVAVAVVIAIGGVGIGLKSAQTQVLGSLYGVGTDVTISYPPVPGSGSASQFTFGSSSGSAGNGTTALAQSKLVIAKGAGATAAAYLSTVTGTQHVAAASSVLMLDNYDFTGIIPSLTGQTPAPGTSSEAGTGADGAGGSSFTLDSFRIAGLDLRRSSPADLLKSTKITSGRGFTAADSGKQVTIVDTAYAKDNQITVGSPLNIGGVDIPVIGLISSAAAGVPTVANAYLPIETAQALSGLTGQVSHIYVKADSSNNVSTLTSALRAKLPGFIVATQADLANTVTGSLTSAAGLNASLGLWLSIIAITAATLFAVLFTVVGVARRTREFGTLKAIGWKSRQIVAQVVGETFVQGVVGAVVGVGLGALAILVINAIGPHLTANLAATGAATSVPLVAAMPIDAALIAAGLAVAASLAAAAAGALRVTLLRPSEALRSAE